MIKIKCPLSAYDGCSELVEVVAFGENTLSAKRGNKKYFLRCPSHGSLRFDKPNAQTILKAAAGGEVKPVTENATIKPEIKPEIAAPEINQPTSQEDEWGF